MIHETKANHGVLETEGLWHLWCLGRDFSALGMVLGERTEGGGGPVRCWPESAPPPPLKSRGTKLYVEREGEVTERGP